jgi:hypothetical protein
VLAVRWYLRYGLSYRDVVDDDAPLSEQFFHVTVRVRPGYGGNLPLPALMRGATDGLSCHG